MTCWDKYIHVTYLMLGLVGVFVLVRSFQFLARHKKS